MKLKEQLNEVEKWSVEDKIKYFEKISENVPIATRIVAERDDISIEEKYQACRLLSEFQHRIDGFKRLLKTVVGFKFEADKLLDSIYSTVKKRDNLVSNEVAFCLKDAYRIVLLQASQNQNYQLQPSIYKLFENEKTEKLSNLIGNDNSYNLEGFILGYFYAIDANEISMHGTRFYPDLRKLDEWIGEDWKKQMQKNNDASMLAEFLTKFRENIWKEE